MFDRVVLPAFWSLLQADVALVSGLLVPRQSTSKVLPTVWPSRVAVQKVVEPSSIAASSTGLPESTACSHLPKLFALHGPLSRPELIVLPELVVLQHRLYVQTPQPLLSRANPLQFPWQVPPLAESLREQSVPAFAPQQPPVAGARVSSRLDPFDHFVVTSPDYSHQPEGLIWNRIPSGLPVYWWQVMYQIWRNRDSVYRIEVSTPLEARLILDSLASQRRALASQRLLVSSIVVERHPTSKNFHS